MQTAKTILSILNKQSTQDEDYVFERLYRNLFNRDFYLTAYAKIYAKEGNMTAGTDGNTIDGFNLLKVDKIISKMRNETYYPKPVKRVYIPKKNGKMRPLGIPAFEDKLVQEVIRQILEAIYEPNFSKNSHGFRPNRSCQTALYQIKSTSRGASWVVEGDIKGCFDNINHEILLKLLAKKINDGRFIELIRRFLKAGYMEFSKVYNSLSGCPQGQIASPILANIYLHELDKYVEDLILQHNKGTTKKRNPEYMSLNIKRLRANRKGKYDKGKQLLAQMRKMPSQISENDEYVRLNYVRYADDWIICVNGSKKIATEMKEKISFFLLNELKLELSPDKTLITNLGDRNVPFLGYEISKSRCNTQITTNINGVKRRSINETIQLLVPQRVITEKLSPFLKNGKSTHHNARINLPVLDMIAQFNREIQGLYNYYCLATDVSTKLGKFKFYHYFSLLKTIARKEKKSVKEVTSKYGVEVKRKMGTGTRKIIGVKYETTKGEKTMIYFNNSLSKHDTPMKNLSEVFSAPKANRCELIKRLSADKCELCGKTFESNYDFEVHHVRKLKDVKQKYSKRGKTIPQWVLTMCAMNRKTLVVCGKCHIEIHKG
ncbi:MAG: group II intron reverse transcriptase/maturase [Tannerella sp.]|jgi:group II intron reverse transcriptase/maturase|nr:group II intron reverse transcriptase/maturase [Tannerella sp.]